MDSNTDPLSQLKDIYLPPDPGIWPPAPGWWILGLLGLAIIWLIYKLVKELIRRQRPWKEMHQHLRSLELTDDPIDQRQNLSKMSKLVRQFAILKFGRESVSSLSGSDWLEFLDSKTMSGSEFSEGIARVLGEQQFKPKIDTDLEGLRRFLLQWSRECK